MVVDTSAVAAIAFGEQEARRFATAILGSARRLVAVPTLLEITIVVGRRSGELGRDTLAKVLDELELRAVPFGLEHLVVAEGAWWQFGKGRHRAGLNYGDCFSYALAKLENEPLLFKRDDFALTDVRRAPF